MTVETATYISDLNATYPAAGDSRTEGDDHIRLIKSTLGASFQNFAGAAVTSTEAELNILDGVTATAAELNYLDIATLGTAAASKAVTVDASANADASAVTWTDLGTVTTVAINGGTADGVTLGASTNVVVSGATMTLGSDADGDTYYRSSNALTRLAKGTGLQMLRMNSGATAPEWADNPVQVGDDAALSSGAVEVFVSAAEAYTGGGQALTADAHGLSAAPNDIKAFARCTDAGGDNGYAQNDVIPLPDYNTAGVSDYGISIWADGTNVDGIVGAQGIQVYNKSTGANATLGTSTDWEIFIVAKYWS